MKLPAIGISAVGWVSTGVARSAFLDEIGLSVGDDQDGSDGHAGGAPDQLGYQPNREHPVFAKLELLPEEVKTPFVVSGEKPIPPAVVPPPTPPAAAASAPPSA